MWYNMVKSLSVLLFAAGAFFLIKAMFFPEKEVPESVVGDEENSRENYHRIDALMKRLDEETEMRIRDEEVIKDLREHVSRLEDEGAGKKIVTTGKDPGTPQILSSVEEIKKVAAEQKKAVRDIKKHVEEDKIKFSHKDIEE